MVRQKRFIGMSCLVSLCWQLSGRSNNIQMMVKVVGHVLFMVAAAGSLVGVIT
jgi:hypothetical protein